MVGAVLPARLGAAGALARAGVLERLPDHRALRGDLQPGLVRAAAHVVVVVVVVMVVVVAAAAAAAFLLHFQSY